MSSASMLGGCAVGQGVRTAWRFPPTLKEMCHSGLKRSPSEGETDRRESRTNVAHGLSFELRPLLEEVKRRAREVWSEGVEVSRCSEHKHQGKYSQKKDVFERDVDTIKSEERLGSTPLPPFPAARRSAVEETATHGEEAGTIRISPQLWNSAPNHEATQAD